jgi:DNA invertase Pin-like site-specific DNA recombinase
MLDDLKKRGVKLRSLTEAIDTETATGRAMWHSRVLGLKLPFALYCVIITKEAAESRIHQALFDGCS